MFNFTVCVVRVNTFSVSEGEVHERLCSESVLLVRREDVLQRLTGDTPQSAISDHPDPRWKVLDVEGGSVSDFSLVAPTHLES